MFAKSDLDLLLDLEIFGNFLDKSAKVSPGRTVEFTLFAILWKKSEKDLIVETYKFTEDHFLSLQ